MRGELRGLTLWRPWVAAFLLGRSPKRVENRPWFPERACGPMSAGIARALPDRPLWLALHNGHTVDRDALDLLEHRLSPGDQCSGAPAVVVAVARLVQVLDVDTLGPQHPAVLRHNEWVCGPFAWEVDDVQQLLEPVPCRGAQGLWKLPPATLVAVRQGYALAKRRAGQAG